MDDEQRPGEHRRNRDWAPTRVAALAPGKPRVSGDAGQGQGEDGGGEVGNRKADVAVMLATKTWPRAM